MKLGIIGLPSSGKTTIFNALTRGDAPVGQSVSGRFDVLTSVVDVPDERVGILTAMFKPEKTAYAKVIYTDIAGLKKGIGESGGMSGPLLNHLAALDGFVHVVRAFANDQVAHLEDTIDPARDLATLDTEFLLSDLVLVETRLTRLKEGLNKSKDKVATQRDIALMEQLHAKLSEERPLRELDLTEEEEKSLRGFGFLTLKPVLVLINVGDEQADVPLTYTFGKSRVLNLRGRLEAELAQLSGDDLEMFMTEYGVTELGLAKVIHESYDLMGLQSFFTVGEDEVRAWTVARGASAVDAAATIHTDLAKGFIRAEVIGYEDFVACGGEAKSKEAGKMRLEGKEYIVSDGDIMHFRFNV